MDFLSNTFGVGSRLKHPPSPEMRAFYSQWLGAIDNVSYELAADINYAHVLMLAEREIIPHDVAKKLLAAIKEVREIGFEKFDFDPTIGDSVPNFENYIIGKVGDKDGGMLHIGRSRGDYYATLNRLKYRERLKRVLDELLAFRGVLIELASRHAGDVMPAYTHLQQAQPITLGYYFCAYVHELERDTERLVDGYRRLNVSPLGLGIVSGTTFPLDRERTSELLGFQGILRNGRDLTDHDYALEAASAATIVMIHLHKLATDLFIWSTSEFSFARVDDSDALTSSMMPQKANPVLLENIRSKASVTIGDLMTVFVMLKSSPTNEMEHSDADTSALQGISRTTDALRQFGAFLPRISFNTKRMEELAGRYWAQATDLADEIACSTSLSFREAHRVVGALVASSLDRGIEPKDVTMADLEAAASSVLAAGVDLAKVDLKGALDVRRAVERRTLPGGPAASVLNQTLQDARAQLDRDRQVISSMYEKVSSARSRLHSQVEDLLAS